MFWKILMLPAVLGAILLLVWKQIFQVQPDPKKDPFWN